MPPCGHAGTMYVIVMNRDFRTLFKYLAYLYAFRNHTIFCVIYLGTWGGGDSQELSKGLTAYTSKPPVRLGGHWWCLHLLISNDNHDKSSSVRGGVKTSLATASIFSSQLHPTYIDNAIDVF